MFTPRRFIFDSPEARTDFFYDFPNEVNLCEDSCEILCLTPHAVDLAKRCATPAPVSETD